jgi:hypothetical protein
VLWHSRQHYWQARTKALRLLSCWVAILMVDEFTTYFDGAQKNRASY